MTWKPSSSFHLLAQFHLCRLYQLYLHSSQILNHLTVPCSFTILETFHMHYLLPENSFLPSSILWTSNGSSEPNSNSGYPQAAEMTLYIFLPICLVHIYINDIFFIFICLYPKLKHEFLESRYHILFISHSPVHGIYLMLMNVCWINFKN